MHKNINANQNYTIGIVSNSTWYTYNFRLGLIRTLMRLGFKVVVIAPKDHYSSKLIAEGIGFQHIALNVYSTNPLKELDYIRKLAVLYKRHQLDFIFHYTAKPNVYGSIAAWWTRIPSIAITTGLGVLREEKDRVSKHVLRTFYRIAGWLSKEVWFLNQDDQDLFLKHRIVAAKKTALLPSEGVDISWYQPIEAQKSATQSFRFLLATRLVWSKGVKEFYEAAKYFKKYYPNVRFQLAGFIVPEHPDGVSYDLVQRWQKEGIVEYLGEIEDIRPLIANADAVLLPSFFGEGVPRVLLEAASMARPIITTDYIGCKEVVQHGVNGFLCKARSIKDLINKLELFIDLPASERTRMGLAGRRMILERFDEDLIIQHYLKALKRHLPAVHIGGKAVQSRLSSQR
ncbi:MAG: glycosyltransferase family 4 protein [Bacteroidota bacterium]